MGAFVVAGAAARAQDAASPPATPVTRSIGADQPDDSALADDRRARPAPGRGAMQAVVDVEPDSGLEISVDVGKSKVVDLSRPYDHLVVADPKIADVLPLTDRSFVLEGKAIGATEVLAYGRGGARLAAIGAVVAPDMAGLRARLREILPDETAIRLTAANHSVVLLGTVSNPVALRYVTDLAGAYAGDKVINMLSVQGVQQVMLSVRFVEMSRTAAKNLNFSLSGATNNGKTTVYTGGASSTGIVPAAGSFASVVAQFNRNITVELDALETKGLVRTLAEPDLLAMSGESASFLAGGEYPIPVEQVVTAAGAVTTPSIEYKRFGVSLTFTPTILQDGLIDLVVNPEVSSIDPTVSVNVGTISVPGLKVRRGHATLELRDGESFAMAGLLMDNYQAQLSQFPFLGDMPVLGALFRSNGYTRNETELVIVITPHLVQPRRGAVATPADHFVPPSDYELFMLGRTEGRATSGRPKDGAPLGVDRKPPVDPKPKVDPKPTVDPKTGDIPGRGGNDAP